MFRSIIIVHSFCFLSVYYYLHGYIKLLTQWIHGRPSAQERLEVSKVCANIFLKWCQLSASSCTSCWSWYIFIGYGETPEEFLILQTVSRIVGPSARGVGLALQTSFRSGSSMYIWKIVLCELHWTKNVFSAVKLTHSLTSHYVVSGRKTVEMQGLGIISIIFINTFLWSKNIPNGSKCP